MANRRASKMERLISEAVGVESTLTDVRLSEDDQTVKACARALGEGLIKTVMVVDDDANMRTSAVRALRPRKVVGAARIADALSIATDERLDLAIVDVHLCDARQGYESGIELTRLLHRKLPELPVVVITGFRTGTVVDAAYQAGASKTFEKPFDWLDVLAHIECGSETVTRENHVPSSAEWGREYVARVMGSTGGNVTRAAEALGIRRTSLQRSLKRLKLARIDRSPRIRRSTR